jgi:polyisoprenoid-binding protein YceI
MLRLPAILLVLIGLPAAAVDCYSVNTAASSVTFEVKQAGAPFRGVFRRFGGEFCLEGDQVVRIDVWLEPASVETDLPEIDAALKDKEFFDVGAYPRIEFSRTSGAAQSGRHTAQGTLGIKGRRRDVDVQFRLDRAGDRPSVSGSFTLNRLDYGVGTGEWADTRWLAADVKVDFSAVLARR